MFGFLKRLLHGQQVSGAPGKASSSRRSATARVLAKDYRPAAADRSKASSDGAGAEAGGGSFDPYNTGKFDRSASWERISRTQR